MAIKKSELYASFGKRAMSCAAALSQRPTRIMCSFCSLSNMSLINMPVSLMLKSLFASFDDLVNLKGTSDIGDQINKRIIALQKQMTLAIFLTLMTVLGSGKEMQE